MVPQEMFCAAPTCPLRGQRGQGNIGVHSQTERRYRCLACGATFAATQGTPFHRLRKPPELVTCVITLLAYGCPPPAIVAAFGLDARTVAAWQARAGQHGETLHRATVRQGQLDVGHVQADELWVKAVGRKVWMAMALAVPSRLWLGGAISARRDGELIRTLVEGVRRCARPGPLLVCVDGLVSYVTAFRRAFAEPVRTGRRGGPRKQLRDDFLLGQVIKSRRVATGVGRVVSVAQRAVVGTLAEITQRVRDTGGGQMLNTAYIERLNATFRSRLAPLVRRGRCLARKDGTLHAGMYLVGTVYNFCRGHDSLRVPVAGPGRRRWRERTPAMAAGLTDHVWSVDELLHYRVAPPPCRWRKRRGRTPKEPRRVYWRLRPQKYVLCLTTD